MYGLAAELFPVCRSLTGNGVRATLARLRQEIPAIRVLEVPTGTKCFDWVVPNEWNIDDAFLLDPDGNKVVDFKKNNLHVVGYSTPIDQEIDLEDLQSRLFSLPQMPDAIPYVTSYYKPFWGFCLTENERRKLKPGRYRAKITSSLAPGHLTYGELLIPGKSAQEILLSTYVCHPSMANNELSGPVVALALAKWLLQKTERHFSYRILFLPETIGSIVYLSRNLEVMKDKTYAGYQLTCVGDDRSYSYLSSRTGETVADRAALHVLKHRAPDFKRYTFLQRGSDERQYCSPGVDLPVASVMRTKYSEYPEYHTSLDDLKLVSPQGLAGAIGVYREIIELLEWNRNFKVTCLGEPQLGKRGLYPNISTLDADNELRDLMNFIAYADGKSDLFQICERIGVYAKRMIPTIQKLMAAGLLEAT